MEDRELELIAEELEAAGLDPGKLHELQQELDCIDTPPGFWGRLTSNTRELAARHWNFVLGELEESEEALGILRRVMTPSEKVAADDKEKLRSQLLDLLRCVPAGILAAGNAALPVPGTSLATPWLLHRLGVMPSRWREGHLLEKLQEEVERLEGDGLNEQAKAIRKVRDNLEKDAETRGKVERDAQLLTHWDTNKNGVWDEEERTAYQEAVAGLASRFASEQDERNWYLLHEGGVFGPLRLKNFLDKEKTPDLLVCWRGQSGWVALSDLLG